MNGAGYQAIALHLADCLGQHFLADPASQFSDLCEAGRAMFFEYFENDHRPFVGDPPDDFMHQRVDFGSRFRIGSLRRTFFRNVYVRLFHNSLRTVSMAPTGAYFPKESNALICRFQRTKKGPPMQMTGNTILITGGGSGIGRGLAEKFHAAGNRVIITGRNAARLADVVAVNQGMIAVPLDITDGNAVTAFAAKLAADYPELNVIVNNAGMMAYEHMADAPGNLADAEATIITNLLGPIRLTSALLPHLLKQREATVINVSSGLAFVPLAATPTYSATKAGLHSWSMAIREQLKDTAVRVVELAPPYVQTELTGSDQATDPNAMPLDEFIDEVMALFAAHPDAEEIIVERCKPLRYAAENGNLKQVFEMLAGAFQH